MNMKQLEQDRFLAGCFNYITFTYSWAPSLYVVYFKT